MIVVKTKHIPFEGYTAMTVWPFVFVRKDHEDAFTEDVERHEMIHGRQQKEMLVAGVILSALLFALGCAWWSLLALPIFIIWYGVEYAVKRVITKFHDRAYESISFEQEAYDNEYDRLYLSVRKHFAWLKYVFKLA